MTLFQKKLLILALAAIGLGGCGGDSNSATASTTGQGTDQAGAVSTATTGASITPSTTTAATPTAVAASAMSASGKWNLSTGVHAADLTETGNWLPLSVHLDTLTASTTSPRLGITQTSNAVTTVSLDGAAVITLTRDAFGLTIRSTAPDTAKIAYQLLGSGTTPITLYSSSDYKLQLTSVTLQSPDGPALNLQSKKAAFIELNGTSTLTDSGSTTARTTDNGDDMDLKATLFAEGAIVVSGTGTLKIEANTRHAIASDDHLRLTGGNIQVRATVRDGLRANNAFIMDDGTLDISTPAGKGIKVEGKEHATDPLGFIAINKGTLTINSHDKAITASWETEDGDTTSTSDDPDPRVTINGGTINITTTGTPFEDTNTADGDDSLSPEGIEAKSVLTINGGTITITSTDDSLNAGTGLALAGGRVHLVSSMADAADSNGTLAISGGYIVARGAGAPEGALDADTNTFAITGGTFVGIGGSSSMPTASATTQNTLVVGGNLSAGLWTLRDASGNAAFSFDLPASAQSMVLSSPKLATGATYTTVTGGTLGSVGENFNGLAIEPTTHTGGTAGSNITLRQQLSTLGNVRQGPGAGGARPVSLPAGTPPGTSTTTTND